MAGIVTLLLMIRLHAIHALTHRAVGDIEIGRAQHWAEPIPTPARTIYSHRAVRVGDKRRGVDAVHRTKQVD